jgi:hypothetical protein
MYKKLIKEVEKVKQENAESGLVLRTEQMIRLATQVLTKEEYNEFLKMREKYEEVIEYINFMDFIMTDELEYIEE